MTFRATAVLAFALRSSAVMLVFTAVTPPALAQPAEDEETSLLVAEARRAIGKRDYTRAGQLLDQAIAVNPRRIDAYVLRATIHGARKEHDKAVAVVRRARQLAPDNNDVLTALGVQLVLAGKPEEGVPLLEGQVARAPNRYEAQVVLGHHYVRVGRWQDGARAFEAYFEHRPRAIAGEDAVHRLDQANAYLRSGRADQARTIYQDIARRDKKNELARLGVAWSTAVLDCGQAMKALEAVADLEARYAEVSIVRARCALTLGNLDAALDGADRYRARRPDDPGGWALQGDIRAAKGNLKGAEASFTEAVKRAPKSPLYSLKLARAERLLGKHQAAAERLRKSGAPSGHEELWTLELAEAMYAAGQYAQVRDHLAPWVQAHPRQPTARFLLGASLLPLKDVPGAVEHLELAVAHTPPEERARPPLVAALNAAAIADVAAGNVAGAENRLERAEKFGGSVQTWRNLGAVRLKLNKNAEALASLRKANDRDKKDARVAHLYARALHASGQLDEARASYRRALKLPGGDPVAIAVDLAVADLASGHGEDAVDTLQEALGGAPAEARGKMTRTYVDTARAAATDWMRTGQFARALKVLRQVDARLPDSDPATVAVRCDLALAATGSAQREIALDYLRRLEKSRARCPFAAPADEVAVPILIAWNEGTQLRQTSKALDRLEKLRRQATGAAEPLLRVAARDIALRAANEAYDRNMIAEARKYLTEAEKYDRRSPELSHNLAVLDLAAGKVDSALGRLTRLQGDVPEAMVNIGIAYDRRGESQRALDYYRRALAAGARFAPLRAWIDRKERLWGNAEGSP
jgi:tetratricopeptide (TPR) repeat protein